jgi:hypothetical protein
MNRLAIIGALLIGAGCAARRSSIDMSGWSEPGTFGERTRVVELDSGVTATIVAPARIDRGERIDLVLYALPNGNTTAETMGRRLKDGVGWRYDIQHIAAQTRALRARGLTQAVVAYLEADTKSWPEWRRVRGYDAANARIVRMVDRLRAVVPGEAVAITLTGHSGGGSFMFGFIEGHAAIPDWLERIAFLDANYNFEPKHGDKLAVWLRRDARHTLVSLAYDDREIMLDGKKVVAADGGTWRATRRMIDNLGAAFPLAQDTVGEFMRYRAPQVELLVHPNPANRILHTEMIGEMNGYMYAMLTRRSREGEAARLLRPARAYLSFVDSL